MLKTVNSGKQISWRDAMRKRPGKERVCRHSLTGRIGRRTCPMNYECSSCDFDQYFEDTLSPRTAHAALSFRDVKGFSMAEGSYFHKGHTWVRIESGGVIRIGLDDFFFKVFGKPDRFELPLTGQELNQGKAGWGVKRKENPADVLSPVNGVITDVNSSIRKSGPDPAEDPYGDGWLFAVHNSDIKGAVKELVTDEDGIKWLGDEISVLENMIEEKAGPLSTDGGTLMPDVYGNLPGLDWNLLVNRFLKT